MNRQIIPHRCPVCNGQGKVQIPPWVAGDQRTYMTSGLNLYDCPGCAGRCIVWEPEELRKQDEKS